MGDLNKVLDGTVEEVKTAIANMSHVDLLALRKIEVAGKNRVGVTGAIDAALSDGAGGETDGTGASVDAVAADGNAATSDAANGTGVDTADHGETGSTVASLDHSGPANIEPATEFEPSGAPLQSSAFSLDHPAVDANPRANTTEDQNRIDFNDPSLDGRAVVEAALKNQANA